LILQLCKNPCETVAFVSTLLKLPVLHPVIGQNLGQLRYFVALAIHQHSRLEKCYVAMQHLVKENTLKGAIMKIHTSKGVTLKINSSNSNVITQKIQPEKSHVKKGSEEPIYASKT
jgi:hypothetical protein